MENKPKVKLQENFLGEEIYSSLLWNNSKLIFIFIIVSFLFFFFNFPFSQSLKTIIENRIYSLPGRPISYAKMEVDYLLFPGLDFEFFKYRTGEQEFKFKTLTFDIVRPSVFPPGIRVELEGESDRSVIDIKTSLSLFSHRLIIEDTKLSDDILTQLFYGKLQVKGHVEVAMQTSLEKEGLNYLPVDGKILLKSHDLELPPQSINGLDVPALNFKNFIFEAEIDDEGKVSVSKFELGSATSPIYLKGTGTIHLNAKNMALSKLALNTEVSFSKQFFENFALLKMMLENKKTVNDMYQVKIQGTLSSPTPLVQ